eukprot:jgi/Mesen1/5927/ME000301S05058
MSRLPSSAQFHKSKTLNDKYLLGDEIGKGAYGRVYKGLDLNNGDFVAIKQVGLENIPNEDLASIMVLEGLVYLHEQGVIHRDIKGANILTTKEGLVKLADFGVATKMTEADTKASVVGTPYWMAPEIIEMSGVTAASDIWSVGCTVIELLTCVPPYYDLQPMPALFRIVQDEGPPIPEGLSPAITDFLVQCFQKDAKSRPDAKKLMSHEWIRTSHRMLQRSLQRDGGHISNVPEVSTVVERTIEDVKLDDCAAGTTCSLATPSSAPPSPPVGRNEDGGAGAKEGAGAGAGAGTGGRQAEHPGMRDLPWGAHKSLAKVARSARTAGKDSGAVGVTGGPGPPDDAASPHGGSAAAEEVVVIAGHSSGIPRSSSSLRLNEDTLAAAPAAPTGNGAAVHPAPQKENGARPARRGRDLKSYEDKEGDRDVEEMLASCSISGSSVDKRGAGAGAGAGSAGLVRQLRRRMEHRRAVARAALEGSREDDDPFVLAMEALPNDVPEGGEAAVVSQDQLHRQTGEVARLMADLDPQQPEELSLAACQQLLDMGRDNPLHTAHAMTSHSVVPLAELMEASNSHEVVQAGLELVALLGAHHTQFLEDLCMSGLIPTVLVLAGAERSRSEIRMQAASVVHLLCHTSELALHMFVACRGLPVLVSFLETDTSKHRELVRIGLEGMARLVEQRCAAPRSDLCCILAKSGALLRLANTLHSLCSPVDPLGLPGLGSKSRTLPEGGEKGAPLVRGLSVDAVPTHRRGTRGSSGGSMGGGPTDFTYPIMPVAPPPSSRSGSGGFGVEPVLSEEERLAFMGRAAGLLLAMVRGDDVVKVHMCSQSFLKRLLDLLDKLPPTMLLKILRCIKQLSADPNALEPLQRADAIRKLVPFLEQRPGGNTSEIHSQVLSALYNLCKINRKRQDTAAEAGIVAPLMQLVAQASPLRQLALPLLCDMAHASRATREVLRHNHGIELYLSLLGDDFWAATALDSLATCLAQDTEQRRVEHRLLKRDALDALVAFFRAASGPSFAHILEPYLKMITRSVRLNSALAVSGLTPLLVSRLDHKDAIARLNLLKMIKAVYEHHPRPKQLIADHDLPRKLQQMMDDHREGGERSGGQVLVKQMASSLLKGLHINTVL